VKEWMRLIRCLLRATCNAVSFELAPGLGSFFCCTQPRHSSAAHSSVSPINSLLGCLQFRTLCGTILDQLQYPAVCQQQALPCHHTHCRPRRLQQLLKTCQDLLCQQYWQ
jgi:hypothetical protein